MAREVRRGSVHQEGRGGLYDALETNDSAVKVLGDETLRTIARELVAAVRRNVTIDWTRPANGPSVSRMRTGPQHDRTKTPHSGVVLFRL